MTEIFIASMLPKKLGLEDPMTHGAV